MHSQCTSITTVKYVVQAHVQVLALFLCTTLMDPYLSGSEVTMWSNNRVIGSGVGKTRLFQCLYNFLFSIVAVVKCPSLQSPSNGRVSFSTKVASVATYSCNHGYRLWGNPTRTCLESGQWSGSQPKCRGTSSACVIEWDVEWSRVWASYMLPLIQLGIECKQDIQFCFTYVPVNYVTCVVLPLLLIRN